MRDHIHTIELVREFHQTFRHPVATDVNPSTAAQRRLRVKLIAEELGELAIALGVPFSIEVKVNEGGLIANQWTAHEALCARDQFVNLAEAADALGDLDYVVQGSNLVFGFPSALVLQEIHDSNMSKLGYDGEPIWDEDGKVVKGPSYHKPNIAKVLKEFDRAEELWKTKAAGSFN